MSPKDRFSWLILTFGGSGAAPKAPGTFGSLAAICVAGILWGAGVRELWLMPALAALIALLHLGVGDRIEAVFGEEDPGAVVSDEACGQWIALAVPIASDVPFGYTLAIGFGLFRLFDITKWLGVGRLEKIPGKWGVLLDDVLAGLYAGLVLFALDAGGVLALLPSFSSS